MLCLVSLLDCRPNLSGLERLRTLIDMFSSNMSIGIVDAGHLYAMMVSASSLTPASRLSEMFHGMTQVNATWLLCMCPYYGSCHSPYNLRMCNHHRPLLTPTNVSIVVI